MIINCEKCSSKFNLDETLLNKNGSKVRCSVCKSVFLVMPPEPEEDDSVDPSLEETVDLDAPSGFEEEADDTTADINADEDFDKAFEDVISEDILNEDFEQEAFEVKKAQEEKETEIAPEKAKRKSRKPGLILIIIIVAFVLILGAISIYLFKPGLLPGGPSGMKPPEQEDLTDTGNKRLDLLDIEGKFFESDKTGKLFIIKGKILNQYPNSRSHILLKGTILDDKSNPIDRKLAYAGNIFTEHELKDITIKEIEQRLKNKTGKNNSNIDVPSQESVPFMIIFYNLPDTLSEYEVETVSSSSGQ